MKMLVFLRYFSNTVAEALHFCLESGISRRFPSGSTIAGGMVLDIAAILGRHSRVWGEGEAMGPDGEVKVGGLHKVPMWDFVQVVVVATRVLDIRFGSWELRQVSGTSEVCLPSAGEKAWLPWC
ncbi:hypothetical protein L3X38_045468 [Prunus dulcis]|uniref:Uncharacterized protein n=1 Tax=Prunus dulcis TaxID=3755 RepID=A0AAD4YIU3_PRUDU|nr:hypothetical protein L3X38_045468 [Prunus dulcis]